MDADVLQPLIKAARRRPIWTPGDDASTASYGRPVIERLLPHRDPFLLLDEIRLVGLADRGIVCARRIEPADPVFRGHFPGRPVYPGVLQLEMIGQAGLCLMHFVHADTVEVADTAMPRDARAVRVHWAEFLAPVAPGDQLSIVCRALSLDDYTGVCLGQVLREGVICSFVVLEVYFVES